MDFQLVLTELFNIRKRLDDMDRRNERRSAQDAPTSGGATSVTAPVTNSGTSTNPNLGLAVTPANPGGAIALQGSYAGTSQSGNLHVNGTVGADTRFNINLIPMLERGGSPFPSSPVDGQQYFNTTYNSWFVYIGGTTNLWRQEFPGTFSGGFPNVTTADNTACPKIEVKRIDQDNTVYFWNGSLSIWLASVATKIEIPFAAGLILPQMVSNTMHRGDNPEAALVSPRDIYIMYLSVSTQVSSGGTYDASNYWTYQLVRVIASGGTANIGGANTTWATGRVAGTRYPNVFTINTQFTSANASAFRIDFATVNSPGGINPNPAIIMARYVGV